MSLAARIGIGAALVAAVVSGLLALSSRSDLEDARSALRHAREEVARLEGELETCAEVAREARAAARRSCPAPRSDAAADRGAPAPAAPAAPVDPPLDPPLDPPHQVDEGRETGGGSAARYARAVARDESRYAPGTVEEIERTFVEGERGPMTEAGQARLREVIDRWPESNLAACSAWILAEVLAGQGRFDDAIDLLAPLVRGKGTDAVFKSGELVAPRALLSWGDAQAQLGNAAEARAAWQRLLDSYPDERDARGTSFAGIARDRLR